MTTEIEKIPLSKSQTLDEWIPLSPPGESDPSPINQIPLKLPKDWTLPVIVDGIDYTLPDNKTFLGDVGRALYKGYQGLKQNLRLADYFQSLQAKKVYNLTGIKSPYTAGVPNEATYRMLRGEPALTPDQQQASDIALQQEAAEAAQDIRIAEIERLRRTSPRAVNIQRRAEIIEKIVEPLPLGIKEGTLLAHSFWEFVQDPAGATIVNAESLGENFLGLAAQVLAAGRFGVKGLVGASGASSFIHNWFHGFKDAAQAKGINLMDKRQVESFLLDDDALDVVSNSALTKAAAQAPIDALSATVAGKFTKTLGSLARKKALSKTRKVIANTTGFVSDAAVQFIMEPIGELSGQKSREYFGHMVGLPMEADYAEIALEGIGAGPTAAIDTVVGIYARGNARRAQRRAVQTKLREAYKAAGESFKKNYDITEEEFLKFNMEFYESQPNYGSFTILTPQAIIEGKKVLALRKNIEHMLNSSLKSADSTPVDRLRPEKWDAQGYPQESLSQARDSVLNKQISDLQDGEIAVDDRIEAKLPGVREALQELQELVGEQNGIALVLGTNEEVSTRFRVLELEPDLVPEDGQPAPQAERATAARVLIMNPKEITLTQTPSMAMYSVLYTMGQVLGNAELDQAQDLQTMILNATPDVEKMPWKRALNVLVGPIIESPQDVSRAQRTIGKEGRGVGVSKEGRGKIKKLVEEERERLNDLQGRISKLLGVEFSEEATLGEVIEKLKSRVVEEPVKGRYETLEQLTARINYDLDSKGPQPIHLAILNQDIANEFEITTPLTKKELKELINSPKGQAFLEQRLEASFSSTIKVFDSPAEHAKVGLEVEQILQDFAIGDKVRVRLAEHLEAFGLYHLNSKVIDLLIHSVTDFRRTLPHEIMHALKNQGLFKSKEWDLLSEYVWSIPEVQRTIRATYEIRAKEASNPLNLLKEEATVDWVADWYHSLRDKTYERQYPATPPSNPVEVSNLLGLLKRLIDYIRLKIAEFQVKRLFQQITTGKIGSRTVPSRLIEEYNQVYEELSQTEGWVKKLDQRRQLKQLHKEISSRVTEYRDHRYETRAHLGPQINQLDTAEATALLEVLESLASPTAQFAHRFAISALQYDKDIFNQPYLKKLLHEVRQYDEVEGLAGGLGEQLEFLHYLKASKQLDSSSIVIQNMEQLQAEIGRLALWETIQEHIGEKFGVEAPLYKDLHFIAQEDREFKQTYARLFNLPQLDHLFGHKYPTISHFVHEVENYTATKQAYALEAQKLVKDWETITKRKWTFHDRRPQGKSTESQFSEFLFALRARSAELGFRLAPESSQYQDLLKEHGLDMGSQENPYVKLQQDMQTLLDTILDDLGELYIQNLHKVERLDNLQVQEKELREKLRALKRTNYFPHVRQGNFFVQVVDIKGQDLAIQLAELDIDTAKRNYAKASKMDEATKLHAKQELEEALDSLREANDRRNFIKINVTVETHSEQKSLIEEFEKGPYGGMYIEDGYINPSHKMYSSIPQSLFDIILERARAEQAQELSLDLQRGKLSSGMRPAQKLVSEMDYVRRYTLPSKTRHLDSADLTPGYEKNGIKALSNYVLAMSSLIGRQKHMTAMEIAAAEPQGTTEGDLLSKTLQEAMLDIFDPGVQWIFLRQLATLRFLWGSVKAAVVQTMQIPQALVWASATLPSDNIPKNLGQAFTEFTRPGKSMKKAADRLIKTMEDVISWHTKKTARPTIDAFEAEILDRLRHAGKLDQGIVVGLSELSKTNLLESYVTGRLPGARALQKNPFIPQKVKNKLVSYKPRIGYRWQQLLSGGMFLFQAFESTFREAVALDTIRRSKKLAALSREVQSGVVTPEDYIYKIAENAINQTQGVYNRELRPRVTQGRAGNIFTFQTYWQAMVVLLKFSKAGPRVALLFLALAGLYGLPGSEWLEGFASQAVTKGREIAGDKEPYFSLEYALREMFKELNWNADLMLHGLTYDVWGWNISDSVRLSDSVVERAFGGITDGLFLSLSNSLGWGYEQKVNVEYLLRASGENAGGVPFSMLNDFYTGAFDDQLAAAKRAEYLLPKAFASPLKTYRRVVQGGETDSRGFMETRLPWDTDNPRHWWEAAVGSLGFQYSQISKEKRKRFNARREDYYYRTTRAGLKLDFLKAMAYSRYRAKQGDPVAKREVEAARKTIHKWNTIAPKHYKIDPDNLISALETHMIKASRAERGYFPLSELKDIAAMQDLVQVYEENVQFRELQNLEINSSESLDEWIPLTDPEGWIPLPDSEKNSDTDKSFPTPASADE